MFHFTSKSSPLWSLGNWTEVNRSEQLHQEASTRGSVPIKKDGISKRRKKWHSRKKNKYRECIRRLYFTGRVWGNSLLTGVPWRCFSLQPLSEVPPSGTCLLSCLLLKRRTGGGKRKKDRTSVYVTDLHFVGKTLVFFFFFSVGDFYLLDFYLPPT